MEKILTSIVNYLNKITTIPPDYIRKTIYTILAILLVKIIRVGMVKIYVKIHKGSRKRYMYNKNMGVIAVFINIIIIILIWESHIKEMMTLISFISAGITIALREIILNFFAGIYIKAAKPFELEDRVEINKLKGDVVNLNNLSFEVLELGERVNGEQSTGRIVHVPNSQVFEYPVKNYIKAFKYIWQEQVVKIKLDSDLEKTKQVLYDIIMKNDVIKETPNKMEDQIDDASLEYRIYFNNLTPIIYTSVVDSHIELYMRYLVHPKKCRGTEDAIWRDIIDANKNGMIELYEKE